MKRLALCADDFGLSGAIDRGILSLAQRQRLTHVSCIVNADGGPEDAAALRATGVGLGLHLNLTEGQPLSPALVTHWPALPSLPRLIVMAHLGRLPLAAIGDELQRQVMAFKAAFGQAPTHLDGHQHVHHLPGVRTLVLDLLAQKPGLRVRHTGRSVGPGAMLKRSLLAATGGRVLGQHLGA